MIRLLDKTSLVLMGLGVALMFQPWWAGGFRVGFFVTLGATIMQIVFGHLNAPTGEEEGTREGETDGVTPRQVELQQEPRPPG